MEFPLLELPFLSREKVLQHIPIADLIEFSWCSLEFKQMIKAIRTRVTGIDVTVHNPMHRSIVVKSNNEMCCIYRIQKWWGDKAPEKVWNFNGTEIKTLKTNEHFSTNSEHSPEVEMKTILSFLLDLFKTSVSTVTHEDSTFPVEILRIQECQELKIKNREMNKKQMNSFLRNMPSVSKKLVLNISVARNFKCDPDLNIRFSSNRLEIDTCTWMTPEMFLSLNCGFVVLSGERFDPKVYVDFIRNWYNSDSTRLKCLKIRYSHADLKDTMFAKFKPAKWDEKQRAKVFRAPSELIDCENGLDIVRKDGLRATIILKNSSFTFAVWHQPFNN